MSSLPGFYTPLSWGNSAPASQDYASMLAPTLSQGDVAGTPQLGAAGAGTTDLWGGIQNWLDTSGILGKTFANGDKMQGWGGLGLGAAQGLLGGYLGLAQLGVAKDTLAANKDQFNKNFAAQQKTTNAALSDRQTARVASNPGAYQSVSDYMKTNGI